ncbi:hypothetical protein FB45DRAFT_902606 [Roridomyces roridus]|uniref:DUF6533 domain-containing protein n=1 Tax=Roridomyces roridus TaxID=1738132 RepID=A0AAD7C442_9AGAR|nr:hypothetical protein FB45DRAFT_902606 [Roridomyces roridus]
MNANAHAARVLRIHHYLFLAPLTFLYWDHLLTLGDEVRYIWNKRKTPSSYFFFVNRYLAVFGNVVVAVYSFVDVPPDWCSSFNMFRQILLIVAQVGVCLLFTLRIYALFGGDRRIVSGMLGIGMVLLGVSIWAAGSSGKGGVPELACNIADPRNIAIKIAIPWEAVFIYDLMIFSALFYKSMTARREGWTRVPLLSLLLRDGSIYFVVMASVNLANILTSYVAEPALVSFLSSFASNLAVTMMSRLMLNLHAIESSGIFSKSAITTSTTPELDTLRTHDLERSAAMQAADVERDAPQL